MVERRKSRLFVLGLFCIAVQLAPGIDIVDVHYAGQPSVPREIPGRAPGAPPGFANIVWIAESILAYQRNPLFWSFNAETHSFAKLSVVESLVSGRSAILLAVDGADAAVLRFGRIFDFHHRFYSVERGLAVIDRETYHGLSDEVAGAIDDQLDSPTAAALVSDWAYELLGGHLIQPRPVFGPDDIGVSLWNARTGEMSLLLPGFVEFRGIGNHTMVAVSFDRFRIAAVANVARASEDEPQRLGWPLYVMRVEYDGTAMTRATVFAEPTEASEAVGELKEAESVRVVDASNYERLECGEQDFWYEVETPDVSGWVFGSKLLIEGQDWQGRLDLRGEPLDLSTITDEQPCNESR